MYALSTDIGYVAMVVVLVIVPILAISAAVLDRVLSRRRLRRTDASGIPAAERPTHAFPVIVEPSPGDPHSVHPIPGDGPGVYRVAGVVRATGCDAELHIDANSRANARVKAELQGVIVTEIVKE